MTVFEKAFVGIIQAAAGVFKCLTICFGEPRQILLHPGEQILHPNVAEALLAPLICFDSALQHMVVHISAATQRFVDSFCLLFGGIQTEFEPFIRSQSAPPFLGHPHDLSNTRLFFFFNINKFDGNNVVLKIALVSFKVASISHFVFKDSTIYLSAWMICEVAIIFSISVNIFLRIKFEKICFQYGGTSTITTHSKSNMADKVIKHKSISDRMQVIPWIRAVEI